MPTLSEAQKLQILSLAAAGWSHRNIATKVKCGKPSVSLVTSASESESTW